MANPLASTVWRVCIRNHMFRFIATPHADAHKKTKNHRDVQNKTLTSAHRWRQFETCISKGASKQTATNMD